MEALRLARHKQFGASSEKSEDTLAEQLSFLFNEAEVFSAEYAGREQTGGNRQLDRATPTPIPLVRHLPYNGSASQDAIH